MKIQRNLILMLFASMLVGCVHLPSGPSVMALPGSGKDFDQFRSDEMTCKQYAHEQIEGYTPRQASRYSGLQSAALGSGLGAAAGAAIGGGHGAAIGAGIGLLFGSLLGSNAAMASGYESQERYDNRYIQCMYAKGHKIPVNGRIITNSTPRSSVDKRLDIASEKFIPPPPPAGNPPPPPE